MGNEEAARSMEILQKWVIFSISSLYYCSQVKILDDLGWTCHCFDWAFHYISRDIKHSVSCHLFQKITHVVNCTSGSRAIPNFHKADKAIHYLTFPVSCFFVIFSFSNHLFIFSDCWLAVILWEHSQTCAWCPFVLLIILDQFWHIRIQQLLHMSRTDISVFIYWFLYHC